MIVKFTLKEIPELSLVGGKAKALIETYKADFPVPNGFVLTVEFFNEWNANLKKNDLWTDFLNEPTEANCIKLKELAKSFTFNEDQKSELSSVLKDYEDTDIFAVRSSSPNEDLEGASFAGGYETTLGVTLSKLEPAIIDSYISMLDFRVVEYKKMNDISIEMPTIAIIVQKQIAADISGVGFSANPQTGKKDEVMINSNFGLGETVVSGVVTPDIYIVRSDEIIKRKISHKHVAHFLVEGGGTNSTTPDFPEKESLSDLQVLELAKLIKDVEVHYNKPIDIEWAYEKGKLYLLQARPITTDLSEVTWEFENAIKGKIYARGSIIELLPDPLAPLYSGYASAHIPATLIKLMERLLGSGDLIGTMDVSIKNGYGYLGFKVTPSFYFKMITKAMKFIKLIKKHPEWVENEELPRIKNRLEELKGLDLESASIKELYDISNELTFAICEYFTFCQIYLAQAYSFEGLFIRHYDKKIKNKVNIPSHVYMLGEDTAPIVADKDLYKLASDIRNSEKLLNFVNGMTTSDLSEFMKSASEHEFYKTFREYLDVHGNMIYDLDFSKPTPHDDPKPILEALKLYVAGHGDDPIKRQLNSIKKREEAEEKVKTTVSPKVYKRFKKNLDKARFFAPYRENGLANMGLCQPYLREVLFELGSRVAGKGIIISNTDIFYMTREEVKQFVDGESLPDLTEVIKARKKLLKKQKTLNAPVLLPKDARIMGIKIGSFLPKDLEEHKGDNVYEGIGVSSGKVTGKAKVILSPEDFSEMKEGDILVTTLTTPAWTPLFAMASGIVADYGGPLSHTSIVAREYDIPAVLGTGGLSKIIKTGQTITVDADNNRVILET